MAQTEEMVSSSDENVVLNEGFNLRFGPSPEFWKWECVKFKSKGSRFESIITIPVCMVATGHQVLCVAIFSVLATWSTKDTIYSNFRACSPTRPEFGPKYSIMHGNWPSVTHYGCYHTHGDSMVERERPSRYG